MARAIQIAKKGQYTTSPNPYIGCVLVKNNQIISEGFTQEAGQAHAEIDALNKAQVSVKNATAYVTLEPCSHTGKTPPCKKLKDAGIDVSVGILEELARKLNRGFFKRMEYGLPFVRIKMAMSLDGKTAMASGESQWITGAEARNDVQRFRALSDAILVLIKT